MAFMERLNEVNEKMANEIKPPDSKSFHKSEVINWHLEKFNDRYDRTIMRGLLLTKSVRLLL